MSKYAAGQFDLVCKTLNVSTDPTAPGLTPYEAVCILKMKVDGAIFFLREKKKLTKSEKDLLSHLQKDQNTVSAIRCY